MDRKKYEPDWCKVFSIVAGIRINQQFWYLIRNNLGVLLIKHQQVNKKQSNPRSMLHYSAISKI
jgi:hypothetical protein